MRLRRHATLLAAIAAVAGLAACSGASDAGTPSAPATSMTTPPPANDSKVASPSAALESAVRSYSGFYTGGNGSAAYAMLSARCQTLSSEATFSAAVQRVHQGYGTTPIATLSVVVNGDSGFATYTYAKSGLNQSRQPWVLESGAWKNDDC
ncbi:hypothetical protein ATK17_3392 [Branchiibius hedensis]|uniref:Lipoprotein n=1 Tax=Branchiibius hedensis TaxID=672460 RepID=A0A2Y9C2F8_9MICO|nr:hypothetical protein [Branchiibius hedensis]PWJ27202.1 hypothetical protein ATK17_3392 [Branchiibius hedensis]SSA36013.1 hypothetical protein SAMN04489750_3392 [Branchiibius hedensis]